MRCVEKVVKTGDFTGSRWSCRVTLEVGSVGVTLEVRLHRFAAGVDGVERREKNQFSMMNMVLIMCVFSKMTQQTIHLVIPFHFSEKYFLGMLPPCVVLSGGCHIRQI